MKTIACVHCDTEIILKVVMDHLRQLMFSGECEGCKATYVVIVSKEK